MKDSRSRWDIPPSWQPAFEAARKGGGFLLVGETDSGKSTLAAALASEAFAAGRSAAIVDADVGQSSIGPPACVGLAMPRGAFDSLGELPVAAFDFVGACSPPRHLLQLAASAELLTRAARSAGADTIVVDTTGLVSGGLGRALKIAKIRLVDPDWLVALQREDEVEHLLAPYRARGRPAVFRLRVSRAVKERSRDERMAHRQRSFAAHFKDGQTIQLAWDRAPMENSLWTNGEPAPGHMQAYAEECVGCEVLHVERRADGVVLIIAGRPDPDGLRTLTENFGGSAQVIEAASLDRLLIGLLGERGKTLALGILEAVDFRRRELTVFTPLHDAAQMKGIRLGALQIARDGTQLGTVEH